MGGRVPSVAFLSDGLKPLSSFSVRWGWRGRRRRWVEFLRPESWREALEIKAAHPGAVPLFGGTDVMVELNFDRERPEGILDLTRIPELKGWGRENGRLRVGAGVTYTRAIAELGERLPGLAIASRTVGSPQIRNRGTIGGNIGSSSPAGDALPPLYASGARLVRGATWLVVSGGSSPGFSPGGYERGPGVPSPALPFHLLGNPVFFQVPYPPLLTMLANCIASRACTAESQCYPRPNRPSRR